MRVTVSGMAWSHRQEFGDARTVEMLRRQLTIVPKKYGEDKPTPIPCWAHSGDLLGVPRQWLADVAKKEHEVTWAYSEGQPTSYGTLIQQDGDYAEQAIATQRFLDWYGAFDERDGVGAIKHMGGLLRADPAFGKTTTALEIVRRLGRTTLIICHKEFLFTQWQRRIAKFQPEAKVGIIREKACDFEGKDIVVAMVHSLALMGEDPSRYPEEIFEYFGTLVVDEVHRIGAMTWSQVPPMFRAKNRLGLTATPRRRDGADKVFWWHFGDIRYNATTESPKPRVRFVRNEYQGPKFIHKRDANGEIVTKILSSMKKRNQDIVREILLAIRAPGGRKLLILSNRLEHLRVLEQMLHEALEICEMPPVSTGFYVGDWFTGTYHVPHDFPKEPALAVMGDRELVTWRKGAYAYVKLPGSEESAVIKYDGDPYKTGRYSYELPDEDKVHVSASKIEGVDRKKVQMERRKRRSEDELYEAERARVIFATFQMVSEGTDVPAVDTLGLTMPISDVEQSYGRARRRCVPVAYGGKTSPEECEHYCQWRAGTCKGKPDGVVFDIVDMAIPLSVKRARYRRAFYEDVGADVGS